MKKNRRKKDKGIHGTPPAKDESPVINFREQLKSQDPEVRDAALQQLRQADVVSVIDSKGPRAILAVANKVDRHGHMLSFGDAKQVRVQVDDEQPDEAVDESHQQIDELRKLVEEARGPWKFIDYLLDPGEEPRFMFTHNGTPHYLVSGDLRGMTFARTREAAKQLVAAVKKDFGIKLVIADIQAVARQSFHEVLANSLQNGANCYFVVNPIDHGGKGRLKVVPLEYVRHVVDGWTVPLADTKLPQYGFTDEGRPLMYVDGNRRGLVLAHTREVAERYAAAMERRKGVKPAVVDIREKTDRTAAEVLNTLAAHGATCACVIRSVTDGGEAQRDFIYPVNTSAK